MSEVLKKFNEIKLKIQGEDLDLQAFALIEAELKRPLTQGEKASIRYLLDQDQASRNAIIHKTDFDDNNLERWK